MGNRGVSSISKSGATAARSTYQPDEKNVRAEVTILAEEAGKTEDGTILLKQLLIS